MQKHLLKGDGPEPSPLRFSHHVPVGREIWGVHIKVTGKFRECTVRRLHIIAFPCECRGQEDLPSC